MIKRGIHRRLAEVGKIKLGGLGAERTTRSGKKMRLPIKYKHFVITTTERNQNGDLVVNKELMEKLGPEPTSIPIMLLYDDIDLNFHTSYALYKGARCMCRGDGIYAQRTLTRDIKNGSVYEPNEGGELELVTKDLKAGETYTIECNVETCPFQKPDKNGSRPCKVSGILTCIIPADSRLGGVYRFRTHSIHTVSSILASLELIKTLTNGVLVGIPLRLSTVWKATEEHGNVLTATVEFDGKDAKQLRDLAMVEQKHRIEHKVNMRLLEDKAKASGLLEDQDDPAEIEQEFYPENVEDVPVSQPGDDEAVEDDNQIGRAAEVFEKIGTPGKSKIPEAKEEEEEVVEDAPEEVTEKKNKRGRPKKTQEAPPPGSGKDELKKDQLDIF